MSASWGYVAIAAMAVLVRYFMAETQACLRIGRAISDTGTKTGFQDAVTPPLSSYLALLSYAAALLLVVAQFWMHGVEAGVMSVALGGAMMLAVGLTVIPRLESDFWTRRILASLVRRLANYRRDGDTMRADAAELLVGRILERLIRASAADKGSAHTSHASTSTVVVDDEDTEASVSIVSAYGAVLERETIPTGGVVDASLLPHPKWVILAAILQQLRKQPSEFPMMALVVGAMSLAEFQEGVGSQPIYPFGLDVSKLPKSGSREEAQEVLSAMAEMEGAHTPERQAILDRAEKERSEIHDTLRSIEEELGVKDSFLYFAYGSNMLTKRLTARTPSAVPIAVGHVERHRLTFDKVSRQNPGESGKCDMERTGDTADRVYGVVFRITVAEVAALDRAEGVDHGYKKIECDVVTDAGFYRTKVYIATDKDPRLRPYHWYKGHVVRGALEHKLPANYIAKLSAVESLPDPDEHRTKKEEAIWASGGEPRQAGSGTGDDRAWVIAKFRDRRAEIETADEPSKAAFATVLATYWKAFLAEHKGPAEFGDLSRDRQMQYYKNWLSIGAKFEAMGNSEKWVPAELLSLYLAAIINHDREFELEIAEFLDKYAQEE